MPATAPKVVSYRRALAEALLDLGEELSDLVVLDADTARSTGTMEFARKFPERFINTGISEQDLVGVAAGVAVAGLRPVAVAFSMFMMRAWEQIRNTVSRDALNVKFVGTHSGLSAHVDGSSHQSLEDVALMRVLPNMVVVVPADDVATYRAVKDLVKNHEGPAYLRLGRDNAFRVYGDVSDFKFRVGGSEVILDPGDVTILASGAMVGIALSVAEKFKGMGVEAGVIDMYSIKPLDAERVLKSASTSGIVITIEEHRVVGGLGSAVAELLSEKYPTRVIRVGVGEDVFGCSSRSYSELINYLGLSSDSVVRKILKLVGGEL